MMRQVMKNVLNEDLLADLIEIKNKTLIVWGERDRMVPLKYAYIFKDKIKDSQLVVIPNVGHSPNLEAPVKLAEIVLNFLKDQEK